MIGTVGKKLHPYNFLPRVFCENSPASLFKQKTRHPWRCLFYIYLALRNPGKPLQDGLLAIFSCRKVALFLAVLREPLEPGAMCYIKWQVFFWDAFVLHKIAKYINFYNEMRPCYALGYDIPNHYEQRYWNGELEKKDTFRNRVLSETPKFVQKKMSTSKKRI